MNNQKKLELTLCGMLPYGLKIKTSMGVIPLVKSNHTVSLMNGLLIEDVESNKNYLPLLHSLDKLTEPILEGGLIPIVELYNKPFEYDVYVDRGNYCIRYKYNTESMTERIRKDLQTTQHWIIEKLKEWHFNIYDLPKEMYIEKSERNGTT